jgi:hypothetical protein
VSSAIVFVVVVLLACGSVVACAGMALAAFIHEVGRSPYEKYARQLDQKAQRHRLNGSYQSADFAQQEAERLRQMQKDET